MVKKMGCDAYADENGEFEIVVTDYENNKNDYRGELGRIKVTGLLPERRLSIEVVKGEER